MTWIIDRRALLASGLAIAASPALAQPAAPGLVRVALKTGDGVIVVDLEAEKAPITTRNFLRYVDVRRFDGCTFYRTASAPGAPDVGIIQGGLKRDPAKVFRPIAHESTIKTGLSHKDGTISMANNGPGTATADFFICVSDQPSFDADPNDPSQLGFAAFGHVVSGMDVVRQIHAAPTGNGGPPNMRGQMLKPPIPIFSVRRVAA